MELIIDEIKDGNMKLIANHLLEKAIADFKFSEKLEKCDKTFDDLTKYIYFKAKKQAINGCACVQDEEVYGWGIHFIDELGKPEDYIEDIPTHKVEKTVIDDTKKVIKDITKTIPVKKTKKDKHIHQDQMTLFDY